MGAPQWTWVSGSTASGYAGSYGTLGVASAANMPPPRSYPAHWTDANGNFWLFGGRSLGSTTYGQFLSDLWEFNPTSGQWTWMGGGSRAGIAGVYGTQGVAAAANAPGGREGAVSWTDASGNLWLFGGQGLAGTQTQGQLNDLWMYSVKTGLWTWVSGASTVSCTMIGCGEVGVYGTQGVAAASNLPGSREYANGWVDGNGNLWLFGGYGLDSNGYLFATLNDMWEFNTASGQWTWVTGSKTSEVAGNIAGTGFSSASQPASRQQAQAWTDSKGMFWLFGGAEWETTSSKQYPTSDLSDLWEFDPSRGQWSFVQKGATLPAYSGQGYGDEGVAAYNSLGLPYSTPGGRTDAVTWVDASGRLWMYAGTGLGAGLDSMSAGFPGMLDDLFVFDSTAKAWTWMGGHMNTSSGAGAAFGAQGVADISYYPGSLNGSVAWVDKSGNTYVLGNGLDVLWKMTPTSTQFSQTPGVTLTPGPGTYSSPPGTIAVTASLPSTHVLVDVYGGLAPSTGTYVGTPTTFSVDQTRTVKVYSQANGYTPITQTFTYTVPPNFTVPSSFPSLTLSAGNSATHGLTVTPMYGFTGTVSFSCSGLPTEGKCSFTPSTLTFASGNAAQSTTLMVSTSLPELHAGLRTKEKQNLFYALLLGAGVFGLGWKRRRSLPALAAAAVVLAGLTSLSGCGGSGAGSGTTTPPYYTPLPNTQTVTITTASGAVSQTTTFSLTVTQ